MFYAQFDDARERLVLAGSGRTPEEALDIAPDTTEALRAEGLSGPTVRTSGELFGFAGVGAYPEPEDYADLLAAAAADEGYEARMEPEEARRVLEPVLEAEDDERVEALRRKLDELGVPRTQARAELGDYITRTDDYVYGPDDVLPPE